MYVKEHTFRKKEHFYTSAWGRPIIERDLSPGRANRKWQKLSPLKKNDSRNESISIHHFNIHVYMYILYVFVPAKSNCPDPTAQRIAHSTQYMYVLNIVHRKPWQPATDDHPKINSGPIKKSLTLGSPARDKVINFPYCNGRWQFALRTIPQTLHDFQTSRITGWTLSPS